MKHPLATKTGLTWMGWMLTATDLWRRELTHAQRCALTCDPGGNSHTAATYDKLRELGLWSDAGRTGWGEFVATHHTKGFRPDDWWVDADGNLCRSQPKEDQ